MSGQLALPMPTARADGMAAALDHAGDDWKNQAYTFLTKYAKAHAILTGEAVSDAHAAAGLPQPPDLRAWGGLYQRAQRERVIAYLDSEATSRRRCSPMKRYRSLVCDTP